MIAVTLFLIGASIVTLTGANGNYHVITSRIITMELLALYQVQKHRLNVFTVFIIFLTSCLNEHYHAFTVLNQQNIFILYKCLLSQMSECTL